MVVGKKYKDNYHGAIYECVFVTKGGDAVLEYENDGYSSFIVRFSDQKPYTEFVPVRKRWMVVFTKDLYTYVDQSRFNAARIFDTKLQAECAGEFVHGGEPDKYKIVEVEF
jgi:hypothetical protein